MIRAIRYLGRIDCLWKLPDVAKRALEQLARVVRRQTPEPDHCLCRHGQAQRQVARSQRVSRVPLPHTLQVVGLICRGVLAGWLQDERAGTSGHRQPGRTALGLQRRGRPLSGRQRPDRVRWHLENRGRSCSCDRGQDHRCLPYGLGCPGRLPASPDRGRLHQ